MILATQVVERASAARSSGIMDRTGLEVLCRPLGRLKVAAAASVETRELVYATMNRQFSYGQIGRRCRTRR